MESIAVKERFISCTNCDHPISSELPTCGKCGLEMSSSGIDELARTEEAKTLAVNESVELKRIAVWFFYYSVFASFFFNKDGAYSTLLLLEMWLILLGAFFFKLVRWHQNHSQIYFELDILEEATGKKNKAIFIILSSICFTAFMIWVKL